MIKPLKKKYRECKIQITYTGAREQNLFFTVVSPVSCTVLCRFYKLLSKRMINIQSQFNVRKKKTLAGGIEGKVYLTFPRWRGQCWRGRGVVPLPLPRPAADLQPSFGSSWLVTVARLVNRGTGTLTSAACSGQTASWSPCSSGRGCSGMRRDQACLETVIIGS